MDKLQRKLDEPSTLRDIAVEPTVQHGLSPDEAKTHHIEGDLAVANDASHTEEVGREGGRTDHIVLENGKAVPRDPDQTEG